MMRNTVEWMEHHQVRLYLLALAVGGAAGVYFPVIAAPAEQAIHPVIGLLLYATFLAVPFGQLGTAFRDWRFLLTVLALNFVVVPVVVFLLSRFVAHELALLVGVLFALLAPCIDYVIVFTGLAGGAQDRLLAASPVLMLAQLALLPLYLLLFIGPSFVSTIDPAPFIEAFIWLIAVPMLAAAATQLAARVTSIGARFSRVVSSAMVPLMMLTLAVVLASQSGAVVHALPALLTAMLIFVVFALVMTPLGALAGRLGGLDLPSRRAVVFSGVTRNSLVVLPLVLALPTAYGLAPLVVVSQTLIELLVMVVLVKIIPRVISDGPRSTPGG